MTRASGLAAAFLLLAGCAALPLSTPGPGSPPGPPATVPAAADVLETRIHELVNRHRTERGQAPLAWDDGLARLARQHSRAMAAGERPFGHDGFDDRARAVGALTSAASVAENVAYDNRAGPDLAGLVVDGWIASGGHRENIEDDFDLTGVGAATATDGMRYFTQIFVRTAE